jgi:hypothetical protein
MKRKVERKKGLLCSWMNIMLAVLAIHKVYDGNIPAWILADVGVHNLLNALVTSLISVLDILRKARNEADVVLETSNAAS